MTKTPSTPPLRRQVQFSPLAWGLLALVVLVPGLMIGGWIGGRASGRLNSEQDAAQLQAQVAEQYALGLEEMESGAYDRAIQRFEWILVQDPEHQGAIEHLAESLVQVYVEREDVPNPLEPTPEATGEPVAYDPAQAAGFVAQAEEAVAAGSWEQALERLVAARQADPDYETPRVDRLLFLALRHRGIQLILEASDLEGGLYHLSLTERFAPLDVEAQSVRGWARLYLIGASFWDIYPDRAAFYFGQLADAAPFLSDRSGIPAIDRYIQALIQYGDQLAEAGEWCAAADQYALALDRRYSDDLAERTAEALQNCENPEGDGVPGGEATATPTTTPTPTIDPSVSPTVLPSESPTPERETPTPEITPTQEVTPEPTATSPAEPTATPEG